MQKYFRCAVLSLLLVAKSSNAEPTKAPSQLERDIVFAVELQKRVTCDSSEKAENPTCTFRYLGTQIEVVNTASALPNIFIRSIGKGQSILPRGSRCIEILFESKSLRATGNLLNVGMLLHSTGKIWPSLDLELRKKCETE